MPQHGKSPRTPSSALSIWMVLPHVQRRLPTVTSDHRPISKDEARRIAVNIAKRRSYHASLEGSYYRFVNGSFSRRHHFRCQHWTSLDRCGIQSCFLRSRSLSARRSAKKRRAASVVPLGGTPVLKFESYKSRQQRCGIELADDGFDVGEAPRKGMQWSNVAVAN